MRILVLRIEVPGDELGGAVLPEGKQKKAADQHGIGFGENPFQHFNDELFHFLLLFPTVAGAISDKMGATFSADLSDTECEYTDHGLWPGRCYVS